MATTDEGVRIGPISLFTLVAALGMAVLSVLTISTARAMSALSQRTATMASEAYQAESCAQMFVGGIDETLASVRARGGDRDAAMASLSAGVDEQAIVAARSAGEQRDGSAAVKGEAKIDGNAVVATFETSSGRRLDIRISINRDVTYTIAEWKATSQAGNVEVEEHLWSGTSS
jgi:hypothetical protein